MNNLFSQFRLSTLAAASSIAFLGIPWLGFAEDVGQKDITEQTAAIEGFADGSWPQELEDDIEASEDCVIASVNDVTMNEADRQRTITANVTCKDGRVFKATQPDEYLPYNYEQ